jgi:hypothetical protein
VDCETALARVPRRGVSGSAWASSPTPHGLYDDARGDRVAGESGTRQSGRKILRANPAGRPHRPGDPPADLVGQALLLTPCDCREKCPVIRV